MKTFHIETLGCKVNQYESLAISKTLELKGLTRGIGKDKNDICVINTCSVTGKGSMQSRQMIRSLIKKNPGAKIIVTGCYAQTEAEDIKQIEGVHHVIGTADKYRIPDMINDILENKEFKVETVLNKSCNETEFSSLPVTITGGKARPFLKIQDGCDSFCTYCIVPHARGRSRSMDEQQALDQIQNLKNSGIHEVVLTGIHIGHYGRDLTPSTSLYSILKKIQDNNLIDRVRLSSIEPGELSQDILELYSMSSVLCNHFHIPLQSGDNEILKRMHRPYKRELFHGLIQNIHKTLPFAGIGADTLIGFPGESHDAFQNTYKLIDELPVTYLHVFPFSRRSGTPAYNYPDQVQDSVIKERCHSMRELSIRKKSDFLERNIGRTVDIIVEGKRDTDSGMLKGVSGNYISVLADGSDSCIAQKLTVELTDIIDLKRMKGKIRVTE